NSRSREELHTAEVFAQIFDDDFVLAEHLFHDEAHLAISGIGYHHAEIAIDGFKRGQSEIGVKPHHFRDYVANLGQELSADVFDLIRTQPANLFHDGERECEVIGAAAH